MSGHVFISHSSKDDGFVGELREALEGLRLKVWVDSRSLRGGEKLAPEIEEAIESAHQFVAVFSPDTFNSKWVRREIWKALEVEARRKGEGYRVIPLLLPGVESSSLPLFFGDGEEDEPVGVGIEVRPGALAEALPDILAALGERMPDERRRMETVASQPVEELILKLEDLKVETKDGKRRACAFARLVYEPADPSARAVESRRFNFTAPLGIIEAEELRWYLEEFYVWPIGIFQERAARVETRLPEWGQDLYRAALAPEAARDALGAWQQASEDAERRFSVFVESEPPVGAGEEEQAASLEAAAELLALPWELLHNGVGFLFHGARPALVRRRLPNRRPQKVRPTQLPIRILLVSPRPEDERTPYLDHRTSARPLVEALEGLGELSKLSILTPPTLSALEEALTKAATAGEPFDVVHFDGHGVYDRRVGLGVLCFEDPKDAETTGRRAVQLVHARQLAEVIRDHGTPLVFLEACQTAKTEDDPTASVAAKLLEEGVASVVAMSHTVLVETARRFVGAFYGELSRGARVGAAMIAGQRELYRDDYRGKLMGAGDLRLQDWFVPVLYQEEQDAQLVTRLPPEDVQQLQAQQRRLNLGHLPDPPPHEFQGRSRELLALERLLAREPYAVVRGRGGEGKTTLAVELARWLVKTNRLRRAAFVSFEQYTDARGVLVSLGQQLLPEGDNWHVAPDEDLKAALQPVERALRDRPTVIVLDNLESVLPDHTGQQPPAAAPLSELFDLCRRLLDADPSTRILFTTRESLPAPFDHRSRVIELGALDRAAAVALVGEVMKQHGLTPKADDPGTDPQEITDLVEAVDRHARALVLLARELARTGVRTTTENIRRLMEKLDRENPGDRENSLYASLELSLRRLPQEVREQIKPLAVFHGGANLGVLARVLGLDNKTVASLVKQLIEVGLAKITAHAYLRLDPALPAYLLREASEAELERVRPRWAEEMKHLVDLLYEQKFANAELSYGLTRLELPNLMAMLLWARDRAKPETLVQVASRLETLLSHLGCPRAHAQATRVREQAARALGEWSHARFIADKAEVGHLFGRGELQAAYEAARRLLQQCLAAGEGAYPEAAYNIAYAYWQFGQVLSKCSESEAALAQLGEARSRFEVLASRGNVGAEWMVTAAISESADCLRDLGRFNQAAAAYLEAIARSERSKSMQQAADDRLQLGFVYIRQQRFSEALKTYTEARKVFETLGASESVVRAGYYTGMAYRLLGELEQAEHACRLSLALSVQHQLREGEGKNLHELGNIYSDMGRAEDAAKCFRQAADIYAGLRLLSDEGHARSNLANVLIELERYGEARVELYSAAECAKPCGHAAQPWLIWETLRHLESAVGNQQETARARRQAVDAYLAYRRDGGENVGPCAQLCLMAAHAVAHGKVEEFERESAQSLANKDVQPWAKVLMPKLQAVVRGERSPGLADDQNLSYQDAAEVLLLLETLRAS